MLIHSKSPILVVDDSGVVRSVVRKILAALGYNDVDEASDGAAALEKIKEKQYGVVISDWNMEPMNGQALLEQIRAGEQHANLPFIMMTSESEMAKIVQAKKARVNCFINKPFNAEALKAKIAQINAE